MVNFLKVNINTVNNMDEENTFLLMAKLMREIGNTVKKLVKEHIFLRGFCWRRTWPNIDTNELPVAEDLGIRSFFRDLTSGSSPGPWERPRTTKIKVSDPQNSEGEKRKKGDLFL